jgi:hypothetical protein
LANGLFSWVIKAEWLSVYAESAISPTAAEPQRNTKRGTNFPANGGT